MTDIRIYQIDLDKDHDGVAFEPYASLSRWQDSPDVNASLYETVFKGEIEAKDIEDIYQESLSALYQNIENGKLQELTCPFSSYFLQICNNQALKIVNKRKGIKTKEINEDRTILNDYEVLEEKVDELYSFCMTTEEEDRKVRLQLLVRKIIASMTDTCKNILHSYYWDDFSTSTIADMFNFSNADSVKTQKYKCMNKFRDKYNELKKKIYG